MCRGRMIELSTEMARVADVDRGNFVGWRGKVTGSAWIQCPVVWPLWSHFLHFEITVLLRPKLPQAHARMPRGKMAAKLQKKWQRIALKRLVKENRHKIALKRLVKQRKRCFSLARKSLNLREYSKRKPEAGNLRRKRGGLEPKPGGVGG